MKLKLKQLEVESFLTKQDNINKKTLHGGNDAASMPLLSCIVVASIKHCTVLQDYLKATKKKPCNLPYNRDLHRPEGY